MVLLHIYTPESTSSSNSTDFSSSSSSILLSRRVKLRIIWNSVGILANLQSRWLSQFLTCCCRKRYGNISVSQTAVYRTVCNENLTSLDSLKNFKQIRFLSKYLCQYLLFQVIFAIEHCVTDHVVTSVIFHCVGFCKIQSPLLVHASYSVRILCCIVSCTCLQCFDAVGLVAGRASGLYYHYYCNYYNSC